jgi:hypothetical protein
MKKRLVKGPPRMLVLKQKKEDISFEGTRLAEDKEKPDRKRKQVDHLEG